MRIVPALLVSFAALNLACFDFPLRGGSTPHSDAGVADAGLGATLSGTLIVPSTITGASVQTAASFDGGVPASPAPIAAELRKTLATKRVTTARPAKGSGVVAGPTVIAGDVIARFEEPNVTPDEALRVLQLDGFICEHGGYASEYLHRLRCYDGERRELDVEQTLDLISKLKGRTGVRFVEPNGVVKAQAIPNDEYYGYQWHYPMMNLPAAWDVTTGASSIVVAVLDTGIIGHPDLNANVLWGIDLLSSSIVAGDGDGRDDDPLDQGKDMPNGGSSWHGTHVAGTIAAASNNGIGVAGVAWRSRILPVRVLGRGGGSSFDIAAGIVWSAGLNVPGVRKNSTPAQVLNLSLGGAGQPTQLFQDAIDAAVATGAVIVVAAGNEDMDAKNSNPCNQDSVICVGALGPTGAMTQYSNYGAVVDVVAPGGDMATDVNGDGVADGVLSTFANASGAAGYQALDGTSMATPHVAGVAALMKALNPSLNHAQIEAVLESTANSAYKCQWGCGAGLVDARAAVVAAKGQSATGPAKLVVSSQVLQLTDNQRATVGITNAGGETLNVSATIDGPLASRVTFDPAAQGYVSAGKSGGLGLTADASGLANGQYTSTLVLTSNGGSASVQLVLTVGAVQTTRTAVVAAMFQDAAGEWKVGGFDETSAAEGFGWTIDVAPGDYVLIGTVDSDGDGNYFEDGEPIGIYRDVQNPVAVSVAKNGRVQELDFMVVPATQLEDAGSSFGGGCSSADQCGGGDAFCADWPSGYCTRECSASDPCGDGAACVAFPSGKAYCLATCTGSSQCRTGYSCFEIEDGVGACLPD